MVLFPSSYLRQRLLVGLHCRKHSHVFFFSSGNVSTQLSRQIGTIETGNQGDRNQGDREPGRPKHQGDREPGRQKQGRQGTRETETR